MAILLKTGKIVIAAIFRNFRIFGSEKFVVQSSSRVSTRFLGVFWGSLEAPEVSLRSLKGHTDPKKLFFFRQKPNFRGKKCWPKSLFLGFLKFAVCNFISGFCGFFGDL